MRWAACTGRYKIGYGCRQWLNAVPASKQIKEESMADFLNLILLICASVGAMAFGILAAYAILRTGFALMRPPERRPVANPQTEPARVS